jgi:hypothetical protein
MTAHLADDLTATVEAAARQFRGLDASVVAHRPSPDRWTIQEVVGHLLDSAANNHQRFVRAQFTDELVFPKYEQSQWVRCQHYAETNWTELIELWRLYNLHLAHVIRRAAPASLSVPCRIGDSPPVTLQFLMEDYVAHLKHHLQKIAERLAA